MSKILQVWKADNFGKGVLNGSQDFFRITPDPSPNGGGAEWGGITGTLSTQTDLQTALDTKQNKTIVVDASITAVNDGMYSNIANATYTDPSPVAGKGYTVNVVNGTATIGSVGYGEGRIVTRTFHSGSWRTKVYVDETIVGSATQTALNKRLEVVLADTSTTTRTGETGELIMRTYAIPANSFIDFSQIETFIQGDKASGTGNSDFRMYIAPNVDNLTGAIQIKRIRLTSVQQTTSVKRIHAFSGTSIRTILTDANSTNTDETTSNTPSSIQTFDRTQLRYFHITITPNSTTESHTLWNVYVLGARLKTTI
jgi:hypothetical protein